MLQTPAFVERMELAEDAEDRVAIFGVEGGPLQPVVLDAVPARGRRADDLSRRVAAALDSRYAAPAFAVGLVVALVLGMLLKR